METKKQVKNYARYTMLKIILYVLHCNKWHCYKNVKMSDLQLAY